MDSNALPHQGITTELSVRSGKVLFGLFRVQVIQGADAGAEYTADSSEVGIGSAPSNQLVLTDPTVSRHHCVIKVTPRGPLLHDLDSTNGTTLAGFRIEAAYLQPGATIGVGETTLRFEALPEQIAEPMGPVQLSGRMLGMSTEMRRVFAVLPRIATSDSTVLLQGETGTGKGLLAELIHQQSPRATGPFVVIDCSAIAPTLIEAELFGHQKGAFTGAHRARAGAFEAARGGTVLIDEIGELRLDLQPRLLRALEERTIQRIGSTEPIRLDMRVIAATNRDLRREVNQGTFRSDLFYRLNVVHFHLPPLRKRRDDITLLVAHFYGQFTDGGAPPMELVEAMQRHDWPGNVRELRGAVERAVLLGDPSVGREGPPSARAAERTAEDESILHSAKALPTFRAGKERAVTRWERAYLSRLIRDNEGNLSRAARAARMDRNHLRELLHRHRITMLDT